MKRTAKKTGAGVMLKRLVRSVAPFNRRLDARFDFFQPLSCKCSFRRMGKAQEVDAVCLDVSRGGMLLMTAAAKIEPGTEMTVAFCPRQGSAVTVRGEVVRTFRLKAEKFYFSGVHFSDRKQPGIAFLLISSTPSA